MKIQIVFYLISLQYYFFSFNLFSNTFEIYEILDLVPFINSIHQDDSTLILFDIDDTLIDSPISLNSGPWIAHYWHHAPKLLPHKMPVLEELMWYVSKTIPCRAVDSSTAEIISICQNSNSITPLALTARPIYKKNIDGIKITAEQLLKINIDFSLKVFPLNLTRHPSFYKGIIYTSGKIKGDFLKQYLISTGNFPKKIIFIDDKIDQIQSVEKNMKELGINVSCFWYRRASMNRTTFNLQIANIQLEYLLKYQLILNDEEAEIIMESENHPIPPEDFFKQLIEMYETTHFQKHITASCT